MNIGLFAPPHDVQTQALWNAIEGLAPNTCRHFSLPLRGTPSVALDDTGVYWDRVNVGCLDVAYIHGFSYMNPVVPPPSLGEVDWTLWQTGHIGEQQRFSFLYSAFAEIERRGVKLFNPPRVHVQNFMKVNVLESLRRSGFLIPKLLCTNDMDTVLAFSGEVSQAVWRPNTGRAAWQGFLDCQRMALIGPKKPPVLLAEIIEGPLIRAYILQGKPLLLLKHNAPAYLPLETLEVFQSLDCPAVYGELQQLAECLGVGWMQVLFVLKDHQAWIYDIDTDPIYHGLPEAYQQRIREGLARRFLGQEDAFESTTLPEQPQSRPTLFLRRMLRILFEFEYYKYRKSDEITELK